MATAVHNNSKNSTTGFAPNELLIGWEPPLATEQRSESKNQTTEEYLSGMRRNRLMAIDAINKVARRTTTSPNRWSMGQLAWLEGKNLPLAYGTAKLAPRRHGPFKVAQVISPVAVRLELPPQWRIHPVFHISLLTPYTETPSHGPNFTRPPPDLIDGEEEYEVEQIRSHRSWGRSKTLQYLIKWVGYPESDNTWENADQIHAPELIKLYHRALAERSIKVRRLRLERRHSHGEPPLHFHTTHPCPLTVNSFSAVNTVYLSPLNLAGPTIIGTSAKTSRDTTASSAPNRSGPATASRHTSSISIRPILQRGNDWTNLYYHPRFRTPECTPATSLPSVAKTVVTPPPRSANSTSTVSSVDYPDVTSVPSARKRSPSARILKITYPSSTSSILQSYTDSNRWSGSLGLPAAKSLPDHMLVVSRNLASTSSRASPSVTSSSGSPTTSRRTTPANINASASSTIALSTTKTISLRRRQRMSADVHR
jgi:Chromo (CHRromatin Organisation MOdifier) domain